MALLVTFGLTKLLLSREARYRYLSSARSKSRLNGDSESAEASLSATSTRYRTFAIFVGSRSTGRTVGYLGECMIAELLAIINDECI